MVCIRKGTGKLMHSGLFLTTGLIVISAMSVELKDSPTCSFPAIYSFGDSKSDTSDISAAFVPISGPYDEGFFYKPARRDSDDHLIIDFIEDPPLEGRTKPSSNMVPLGGCLCNYGYVRAKMEEETNECHGHITFLTVLRTHRKLSLATNLMSAAQNAVEQVFRDEFRNGLQADLERTQCFLQKDPPTSCSAGIALLNASGLGCKEIVSNPEFCGKITFPVSLKQPGPRDDAVFHQERQI
ncbi:hypothetical protein K1719_002368 [Acacia pycnantha]|nr:hypothetical protein K1719_002368 [Acacia pycnantha]